MSQPFLQEYYQRTDVLPKARSCPKDGRHMAHSIEYEFERHIRHKRWTTPGEPTYEYQDEMGKILEPPQKPQKKGVGGCGCATAGITLFLWMVGMALLQVSIGIIPGNPLSSAQQTIATVFYGVFILGAFIIPSIVTGFVVASVSKNNEKLYQEEYAEYKTKTQNWQTGHCCPECGGFFREKPSDPSFANQTWTTDYQSFLLNPQSPLGA